MQRILILGGTAEARQLAERLAERPDLSVTLSLAGRTRSPTAQPVPVRIGGFGGVEGLINELAQRRIDILIDATHPYAAVMSTHAVEAARLSDIPLLMLKRPAWTRVPGDRWTEVEDVAAAVAALGSQPRRVFLALGRKELAPFEAAPGHHYVIRSVDPVDPPLALADAVYLNSRGPFAEADECARFAKHGIELVVARNSGGPATYGKIAAARALGIPVILLRRPLTPRAGRGEPQCIRDGSPHLVETVEDAIAWLDHALTH
jgi:precorrin-6A/cobalt-precorrin-6A reductase